MEKIPKKIHYCWFGGKPKPKDVLACIESWKEIMPDYEIFEWNEKNYTSTSFFFTNSLKNKKYAFASDFARLEILYKHGGVYLDTDMLVLKRFDDLLLCHSFWGMETETEVNAAILGSQKGNSVLGDILKKLSEVSGESFFNTYTIVILATNYFTEKGYKVVPGDHGVVTFFPVDYFYPFPFNGKKNPLEYRTVNTYTIHLWSASWFSSSNKVLLCLYRGEKWKAWGHFFSAIRENVGNIKALPFIIKKTFTKLESRTRNL